MDKRTSKAYSILQDQIGKIKKPDFNFDSWETQTASLLELYFGKESEEYLFMKRIRCGDADYGYGDARQNKINRDKKYTEETKNHLQSALETLNYKGVYTPKKSNSNYFSHFTNAQILVGIFSIFLVGMGATKGIYEIIDRYDKSAIRVPTNKIPDTQKDTGNYKRK
jgi:hypothetical protein